VKLEQKTTASIVIMWLEVQCLILRAGVSAKIFKTETLSKKSRRDRDLNMPRPKRDTRLLKLTVYKLLRIF